MPRIRTFHITGTCGGTRISRIACGRLGGGVAGADAGPLHITITSNTHSWQEGDLSSNEQLVSVYFNMERAAKLASTFLLGCANLQHVGFSGLRAVEVLGYGFLCRCSNLREIDLSPLVNLREVGGYFLSWCSSVKSIDLTPLRAVEVLPNGFLFGCRSLREVDLSPFVNLRKVGDDFLCGCINIKAIILASHQPASLLPSNVHGLVVRVEEQAPLSSHHVPESE